MGNMRMVQIRRAQRRDDEVILWIKDTVTWNNAVVTTDEVFEEFKPQFESRDDLIDYLQEREYVNSKEVGDEYVWW